MVSLENARISMVDRILAFSGDSGDCTDFFFFTCGYYKKKKNNNNNNNNNNKNLMKSQCYSSLLSIGYEFRVIFKKRLLKTQNTPMALGRPPLCLHSSQMLPTSIES